jgi:3-hydroxyacyl-CoA dehydrogenase, NAD binding domain
MRSGENVNPGRSASAATYWPPGRRRWWYSSVRAPEDPPRTDEVEFADDLGDAVCGAWMMIEVVPEKLAPKREVFGQLDELAESDAILASNSSSLPTSRFIDKVKHPEGTVASDEPRAR